jgi:predicted ATPase
MIMASQKEESQMITIERVRFQNFKALQNATLPLGRFTLIIGPNGSGKSSALVALEILGKPQEFNFERFASVKVRSSQIPEIRVVVEWGGDFRGFATEVLWRRQMPPVFMTMMPRGQRTSGFPGEMERLHTALVGIKVYRLDPRQLAAPVHLQPTMALGGNGSGLAGVLDRLRDQYPERFESLTKEFTSCLPEFNRVLFDTPSRGQRGIVLRTADGNHNIHASEVSDGALFILAILTLAYLPAPPSVMCLEDPDHGIHPRLLRSVKDALHRLSHPSEFGETRDAVQVIATTHSPYLLDLFKEHPEEVVIAEKVGTEAKFERLSERKDMEEILSGAPLGEAWYTGVLGGVPPGYVNEQDLP